MGKQPDQRSKVFISATAIATVAFQLAIETKAIASSDADYTFGIDDRWRSCQQIDPAYQEVYAFETASFYINICQKDDAYFYSGEAKHYGDNNSIFIPIYPLENGSGFQAENGNVSYLVLLPFNQHRDRNFEPSSSRPTEAILTIKRNNRLVAVESSLNKYCHPSSEPLAWESIEIQPQSQITANVTPQQDIGSEFSVFHHRSKPSSEKFDFNSRFDFYRIGGELHRLATCD